ncbi:unnamed protein product, partial [Mesorhabditis belari]|uniref:Uncharacterized protein n=1 Tax=Mesorhabditis belari TaxID=2138241 RepID=A0AAF3ELR3_9BILA
MKINIQVHFEAIFRSRSLAPFNMQKDLYGDIQVVRTSWLRPSICQAAKKKNDMLDELLWKVCVERITIES